MTEPTNEKYFTAEDIEHVRQYLTATDDWEKEKIYNRYLYKFIDKQIDAVMKTMNIGGSKHIMENYMDFKQDLHIHILTKVLPVVDVIKVQAIQNLLWISLKNKLINMLISMDSRTKIKYYYNDYNLDEHLLVDNIEWCNEDIIAVIDNRIEELKREQAIVNCVDYTFLEHLDRYIKTNDYNAAGFKEYCMNEMKIGNSRFMNLAYKFGFRTIAFKKKKNQKDS